MAVIIDEMEVELEAAEVEVESGAETGEESTRQVLSPLDLMSVYRQQMERAERLRAY